MNATDQSDSNPYESPGLEKIERAFSNDGMISRGLFLIVSTAIMFSAFGGGIGWLLSVLTPAYYRNAFNALDSEVWQIGVGLGITQGLICGVVVGCVVLLATAWYRSRIRTGLMQQYRQNEGASSPTA